MDYIQWTGDNFSEVQEFTKNQCTLALDTNALVLEAWTTNEKASLLFPIQYDYIVRDKDGETFEIWSKKGFEKKFKDTESLNKIDHPPHYTARKIECIDVTQDMNFCLGNAIKYIWRSELKGNKIEDLKKAIWYLNREITREEN